jgi:hypothetical protein
MFDNLCTKIVLFEYWYVRVSTAYLARHSSFRMTNSNLILLRQGPILQTPFRPETLWRQMSPPSFGKK